MERISPSLWAAKEDFRRARQQAALQEVMARFTGRSVDLLSFEDVRHKLKATAMADRGLQEIPIAAIVGTVGRYTDFTRSFLPRSSIDEARWAHVMTGSASSGLAPIDVYKIGGAYFVNDGHHRVSVARALGADTISAYVTEVQTPVPLKPDTQPDELILKAEYADFLERTRLAELRPGADLSLSVPGQYARLADLIEVHRYVLETERGQAVSDAEAVADWYDHAYLPVVQVIRERGMLRDFPDRTETDLYLWVTENLVELREALGWQVKPAAVVASLAEKFRPKTKPWTSRLLSVMTPAPLVEGPSPGEWRQNRLEARYVDRLFADILVPISGEPNSWSAVDQAIVIARREHATLMGLRVVPNEDGRGSAEAAALQAEFKQRCEAAGVVGSLAVEVGEIAARICERAALADLVVLNLAHPPGALPLERLSSGFRTILRRCPRPVLAVPRQASAMQKLLLAYDGSPKAKEALFVAAYLAGEWSSSLLVMTVVEGTEATPRPLDFVREYLAFHEVEAAYVESAGPVPTAILETAQAYQADLILMGGYGANPVVEVVVGSAVDQVLRAASQPMLICR
jgi:nucleotide-binding universal stress UspA family protein